MQLIRHENEELKLQIANKKMIEEQLQLKKEECRELKELLAEKDDLADAIEHLMNENKRYRKEQALLFLEFE
jgi:cell shape-determining protein MreC